MKNYSMVTSCWGQGGEKDLIFIGNFVHFLYCLNFF